jgi:diguanylate cyclase (GGDEF)-like protein
MNVLIAEDDPASRHILQRIIGSLGHRVAAAANGREAWEQLQAGEFSFVITDWMMPEWDGLELCRRIRSCARPDYVYIIIQTSRSGQEDLLTGMDAGADDFIVKPVDRRELQVRMRAAERLLRLQRELRDKNDQLELINARLRRLSRLDPLTGLGNRLAFEERITEFHHRALRYGSGYAVILCDADHFKAYNDTEGHLAGDEVLRRISAALTGCLRSSDGAFRYGGEEIVILLPEQGLTEARRIAERLRSAVESLAIVRRDGSGRAVTISCGVAAFSADSQAGDWEAVIEQADQALYRAKAMGRNRVEAFPLSAPAPEAIPAQVDV